MIGQPDRFGGSQSQAMIQQNFERSQKFAFGHTLEAHVGMKGLFARVGPARDLLNDLRTLQIRRHFWSTMLGDKMRKTPIFAN
jgi:hypothetical protein